MLKDWNTIISSWLTKSTDVPDGQPDEIYRPYTTKFDLEVDAIDLRNIILEASPDKSKGWLEASECAWNTAIEAAKVNYEKLAARSANFSLPTSANAAHAEDIVVAILVDQSGSMKGELIAQAAAASKMLVEILLRHRVCAELLGFSTAGWHGGFSRKLWKSAGQPSRPGRLCALMHIVYKSADEAALSDERWRAMLNPDVLRENVDGEAILWAANRLKLRPEKRKILLVISDGASVDDSTLMQNGPSYLERHLVGVINEIEENSDIDLAAIGIGHAVDRYYRQSVTIANAAELPKAMQALLGVLFAR